MSDEIPPASDSSDPYAGLGTVPLQPEQASPRPTVPIGGGNRPTSARPTSQPLETTGEGTRQNGVAPAPSTSSSAKPLVIGLSVAAAGLATLSGYGLIQANEHKQLIDDANANVAKVEQTNKALDSDLKTAIKDMADAQDEHKDSISKKDDELREAKAKATEASDELAKQEGKVKELESKIEAANSAVQEKAQIENALVELKNKNEEIADQKARAEQEVLRLTGELSSRKTVTPVSGQNQDVPSPTITSVIREDKPEASEENPRSLQLAWKRLGKYETGKNKGRWYFEAPDGFVSPLYGSREMAVYQAELRAGFPQSEILSQMKIRGDK
jgi:hypothetical protein